MCQRICHLNLNMKKNLGQLARSQLADPAELCWEYFTETGVGKRMRAIKGCKCRKEKIIFSLNYKHVGKKTILNCFKEWTHQRHSAALLGWLFCFCCLQRAEFMQWWGLSSNGCTALSGDFLSAIDGKKTSKLSGSPINCKSDWTAWMYLISINQILSLMWYFVQKAWLCGIPALAVFRLCEP